LNIKNKTTKIFELKMNNSIIEQDKMDDQRFSGIFENVLYLQIELPLTKQTREQLRVCFKDPNSVHNECYVMGMYHLYITKDYSKMKKAYESALVSALDKASITRFRCRLGHYYQYIEKDYDEMKYHLRTVIDGRRCVESMHNLGCYYYKIEKNYEKMKLYLEMAVERGYVSSMFKLGFYYQEVEKDYVKMKKYFEMAIEKGENIPSMFRLGLYHQDITNNDVLMKIWYLRAIQSGNIESMNNLAFYYEEIEKNYDQMRRWYEMAIEKGCEDSMYNLVLYYADLCYDDDDGDEGDNCFDEDCYQEMLEGLIFSLKYKEYELWKLVCETIFVCLVDNNKPIESYLINIMIKANNLNEENETGVDFFIPEILKQMMSSYIICRRYMSESSESESDEIVK